jgi:hypothetical protein
MPQKYLSRMSLGYRIEDHPLYQCWKSMHARCENTNNPSYWKYGGRGIKVCRRWDTFKTFVDDMGKRSIGLSLDRIDNNGNYTPDNCRWATGSQQCYNRTIGYKLMPADVRRIHKLWASDRTPQWKIAERFGVHQSEISRVLSGKRRPLRHI